MGHTFARHSKQTKITRDANELTLTLCNLFLDRNWLQNNNLNFPEKMFRCEENLLFDQMKNAGAKMSYFPELFVYHFRRTNLLDIFILQLKSGFYRGIHLSHPDSIFKKAFIIPILTGFSLVILPLFFPSLFLSLIKLHLFLNILVNIVVFLKSNSALSFVYGLFFIPIIHLGFSIGVSVGWVQGKLNAK